MYKEISAALESIDTDLNFYRTLQKTQLKHINKIERLKQRLKQRAVDAGDDDAALERTNQLVQLRKDYAYTSGMIDGLKHAGRTILHYLGEEI